MDREYSRIRVALTAADFGGGSFSFADDETKDSRKSHIVTPLDFRCIGQLLVRMIVLYLDYLWHYLFFGDSEQADAGLDDERTSWICRASRVDE